MIDSKVVSKEIKRVIFSRLRELGFTQFTTRSAWKVDDEAIQVISIQSFNSYIAGGVGCTTCSFGVSMGVYLTGIEPMGDKLPPEHHCHIRRQLVKGIDQTGLFTPYDEVGDFERSDVWYVFEDGSNLEAMVADAAKQIEGKLKWLQTVSEPAAALKMMQTKALTDFVDYGGNLGSPQRKEYIAALEKSGASHAN